MGCRELRWSSRFCLLQCSTRGLPGFPPTGLLSRAKENKCREKTLAGEKPCIPKRNVLFAMRGGPPNQTMQLPSLARPHAAGFKAFSRPWQPMMQRRCQLVPTQRAGCYEFFSRLAGGQQHPGFRTPCVGQHLEQRPQHSQRSRPPTFQLAPAAARKSTTTARCGHRPPP